mgnify:FL=1
MIRIVCSIESFVMSHKIFPFLFFCFVITGCHSQNAEERLLLSNENNQSIEIFDSTFKTIHIFVALCDNKYQGIVPVPSKIGNGQDPDNNLYWGCGFGIRTYFKKSKEWELVKILKPNSIIHERLIFKNTSKNFYLIADAYDGKFIKKCTQDFLNGTAGINKDTIQVNNRTIGVSGNASLLVYIGHDGLMDFDLEETYMNSDGRKRDVIILACYSRSYFSKYIQQAEADPLVWTTGLMCPEAYTVHDAISGYVLNESNEEIRIRAANAYSKFQKCSIGAAKKLLVTGP